MHRARGAHPSPGCPLSWHVFVLRLPCLSSLWKMGANHPSHGQRHSLPPTRTHTNPHMRAHTHTPICRAVGPWHPGWLAREGASKASRAGADFRTICNDETPHFPLSQGKDFWVQGSSSRSSLSRVGTAPWRSRVPVGAFITLLAQVAPGPSGWDWAFPAQAPQKW